MTRPAGHGCAPDRCLGVDRAPVEDRAFRRPVPRPAQSGPSAGPSPRPAGLQGHRHGMHDQLAARERHGLLGRDRQRPPAHDGRRPGRRRPQPRPAPDGDAAGRRRRLHGLRRGPDPEARPPPGERRAGEGAGRAGHRGPEGVHEAAPALRRHGPGPAGGRGGAGHRAVAREVLLGHQHAGAPGRGPPPPRYRRGRSAAGGGGADGPGRVPAVVRRGAPWPSSRGRPRA